MGLVSTPLSVANARRDDLAPKLDLVAIPAARPVVPNPSSPNIAASIAKGALPMRQAPRL